MKLYYTLTSPYARKCLITLHLTGLLKDTELIVTDQFSEEFRQTNPLGKIPALRDGDLTLYDSPLICEYLDDKNIQRGDRSLFGRGQPDYYHKQLLHVQANGVIDAAVASVYERRRETEPSDYWLARWQTTLQTTVQHISLNYLHGDVHIGSVAMITALGYLDFRLSSLDWREWNPSLGDWYASFADAKWVTETQPQ